MQIDDKITTAAARKQFNDIFPFLKLEFFRKPNNSGAGNTRNNLINEELRLSLIQRSPKKGKLEFDENISVKDLEKRFEKEFGLFVQVFRKSGRIWLETTATDNWSLQQQNEEGKSIEEHLSRKKGNESS